MLGLRLWILLGNGLDAFNITEWTCSFRRVRDRVLQF